jgi:hypothetical protein
VTVPTLARTDRSPLSRVARQEVSELVRPERGESVVGSAFVPPCGRNIGARTGAGGSPYDTHVIVGCVAGWIGTDLPNVWEWIGAVLVASFVSVMYWIGRGRRP